MNELLIAVGTGKQSLQDHITAAYFQTKMAVPCWHRKVTFSFPKARLFHSCCFQREFNVSHRWEITCFWCVNESVLLNFHWSIYWTMSNSWTKPVFWWMDQRSLNTEAVQPPMLSTNLWSVSSFLILTTSCCLGKWLTSNYPTVKLQDWETSPTPAILTHNFTNVKCERKNCKFKTQDCRFLI